METDEEPPDCPVGEGPNVLDVVSGAPLALDEIIEEGLLGRDQPGTVGEVVLPGCVHQTLLSEALHLNLTDRNVYLKWTEIYDEPRGNIH